MLLVYYDLSVLSIGVDLHLSIIAFLVPLIGTIDRALKVILVHRLVVHAARSIVLAVLAHGVATSEVLATALDWMLVIESLVEFAATINLLAVVDVHRVEAHFIDAEPFLRLQAVRVLSNGTVLKPLLSRGHAWRALADLSGRLEVARRGHLHLLVISLADFHI